MCRCFFSVNLANVVNAVVLNLRPLTATIDLRATPPKCIAWHLGLETITPEEVELARVSEAGGRTSLRCLDKALELLEHHRIDALLFAPFNKASMTLAGLNAADEHQYIARALGHQGYHGEINLLDGLMTTRVTSHIPLKDVAQSLSGEKIAQAVDLAHKTLKRSGNSRAAIAVAALNPHAGDGGKFGREEIDIIAPAVKRLQDQGYNLSGPWPADTIFLRAQRGEADAIVTMYHDQGQIAVKLLGFERGTTLVGGLTYPVGTPAHGTAFDIVGQNKAHPGAIRQTFDVLVAMAHNVQKDILHHRESHADKNPKHT